MKKRQMDLEDYIAKKPQGELNDAFTGELFTAKARNHYEENSGIPHAPAVDYPRPTIRQRVENLLNRGVDPLAHYVGTEGIDLEVPDDPDTPLTHSERNYLDAISESLAEAAPLPDEGLPRPQSEVPSSPPQNAPVAPAGVSSPPLASPPAATVPSR